MSRRILIAGLLIALAGCAKGKHRKSYLESVIRRANVVVQRIDQVRAESGSLPKTLEDSGIRCPDLDGADLCYVLDQDSPHYTLFIIWPEPDAPTLNWYDITRTWGTDIRDPVELSWTEFQAKGLAR